MPSAMTFSYLVFPSGTPVPGTEVQHIVVPDGLPQTLDAPEQFNVVAAPGDPSSYLFAFWAVSGTLQATQVTSGVPDSPQVIEFLAPTEESFNATAWYVAVGGDGAAALAWAFSLNEGTPILTANLTSTPPFASVLPSACVEGPNTVSTTDPEAIAAGKVTITAVNLIEGYGRFQQWFQFFGNSDAIGDLLTVPADGSSDAIAVYSIPQPDPCLGLRQELASIQGNPQDFPNPGAYQRAVQAATSQLRQCEQEYGEPLTP
jgi:hypothetical protein